MACYSKFFTSVLKCGEGVMWTELCCFSRWWFSERYLSKAINSLNYSSLCSIYSSNNLGSQDPNIVLPDSWPLLLPPMISSFVVSLVLYPSPLSLLPLPALVCAVLYVGNGFSGMGENGPKNERGSLYTYNNQKRNRGPEVPIKLNGSRTVISSS